METRAVWRGWAWRMGLAGLIGLAGLAWLSQVHTAVPGGRADAARVAAPALGAGPLYAVYTDRHASNECTAASVRPKNLLWYGGGGPRPQLAGGEEGGGGGEGPPPECLDFVTGGGFFEPPNSTRPGRVNFGFNAGPRSLRNPDIKGHLNLVDHGDGTHVSGRTVDTYSVVGGDAEHCRMFEGDADVNGTPGFRYRAGVCDYGEPGRDDRFQLTVTLDGATVYFADNARAGCPADMLLCGELDGGNIQLHRPKCERTGSQAAFRGSREARRSS